MCDGGERFFLARGRFGALVDPCRERLTPAGVKRLELGGKANSKYKNDDGLISSGLTHTPANSKKSSFQLQIYRHLSVTPDKACSSSY